MCTDISKDEILKFLTYSIPVYVFDKIDSTNSFAKKLDCDSALIVSKEQDLGRGRMSRSFYSPKGGIYMSVLLPVQNMYQSVPFITTAASVAVNKAIVDLYQKNVTIKWVNDIYLENKKVAGILCESKDSEHAIIGIGVNFEKADLPLELSDTATFLFDSAPPPNEFIARVADNLISLLNNLPDTSFMEYYKANSLVLGKDITITTPNGQFTAKAIDIDSFGALIVKTVNGEKALNSGEITIRFKN